METKKLVKDPEIADDLTSENLAPVSTKIDLGGFAESNVGRSIRHNRTALTIILLLSCLAVFQQFRVAEEKSISANLLYKLRQIEAERSATRTAETVDKVSKNRIAEDPNKDGKATLDVDLIEHQEIADYLFQKIAKFADAPSDGCNALQVSINGTFVNNYPFVSGIEVKTFPCDVTNKPSNEKNSTNTKYNNTSDFILAHYDDYDDDSSSGDISSENHTKNPFESYQKSPTFNLDSEFDLDSIEGSGGEWENYVPLETPKLSNITFPETTTRKNGSQFIRLVPDIGMTKYKPYSFYPTVYWKVQDQTEDSDGYFHFLSVDASVIIRRTGFYRIRAQFTFSANDSNECEFDFKVTGITITKCQVDLDEENLLSSLYPNRNLTYSGSNQVKAVKHRACSTTVTPYLAKYDYVEVECVNGCRELLYEPHLTYWSIEKI